MTPRPPLPGHLTAPGPQPDVISLPSAARVGVGRDDLRAMERRGVMTRPFRGTYVLAGLAEADQDGALLRAAAAHLGPEACAVVGSAALLHGVQGIIGARLPEFALPPGLERQQRDGIVLHFWAIHPDDVTEINGIRVTNVRRTLADLCRLLPRLQAVSCLDSAVNLGLIDVDDVADLGLYMARRPHSVAGRRRLPECRLGAQSPLETRVRLRASDAGLPPDRLQVPIRDSGGQLLGYGDMGYALRNGSWLVVEADGREVHEAADAVLHDRRRQNAFLTAGVPLVRFTWADTTNRAYIPSVLRPLLDAAGWRPSARLS